MESLLKMIILQVIGSVEDENNRVSNYKQLIESNGYSSSDCDPSLKIFKFPFQYYTK